MLAHGGSISGLGIQLSRVLCGSNLLEAALTRAEPSSWRFSKGGFVTQAAGCNVTPGPPSPPKTPWYRVKEENQLPTPSSPGDEGGGALTSHHSSLQFAKTLNTLRSTFPAPVWSTITGLFPDLKKRQERPLCIDIAVGAEGRAGVELARLGFHVIGVEATPALLAKTFEYAQAHNAHIELMTAKVEHSLLADGAADVVTFMHGLHLVDTQAALREAWRLLKPHGHLVAAWNDRDLSSEFISELEDVVERHIPSYNRYHKQRQLEPWGEQLEDGGMFKILSYSVYSNPVPMKNAAALLDVLDCMSFVRTALHGDDRKKLNDDVRSLLERRFGRRSFELPLETKLFVLRKIHDDDDGSRHHNT